jgi:peptide/nickel transport system substrate-binding protein
MDELIARAARALDPTERAELYRRFQRLAAEQLPLIPVVEFTFLTVASTRVRGVADNPRWATSHWAETWLEG